MHIFQNKKSNTQTKWVYCTIHFTTQKICCQVKRYKNIVKTKKKQRSQTQKREKAKKIKDFEKTLDLIKTL